jgi:transposase-like protein
MSTRSRYTDEFKIEAVQLTETSNATIAAIAKELGASVPTLNEWRAKAKRGKLRDPGGKLRASSSTATVVFSTRARRWFEFCNRVRSSRA